jgi:hypothetical protein
MFTPGKKYKRKEIHNEYGGNRQGGIASCSSHPYIFIFTGKSGVQHGYEDGWHDNIFYYTGAGQSGDMEFKRGNKALLEHSSNNKKVMLFESDGTGYVEHICELSYIGFELFETPDTHGINRTGIKFRFAKIGDDLPIEEINEFQIGSSNRPNRTERRGLVTSRVGQNWYRIKILEKWNNKCAVTGITSKAILIASHIVPWKDSNEVERLDPENGILLSPNLDSLFDKYLISFRDSGEIILSDKFSIEDYKNLGVFNKMKLSTVTNGMKAYLKRHREIFNNLS